MPKRYRDLYSILKHPKIKLKIGEKEAIYRGDDAGDNEVISDRASGDDIDDMDDTSSDHLLLLLLQVILLLLLQLLQQLYLQPLIIHLLPIVRSITSLPLFVLLQAARRS